MSGIDALAHLMPQETTEPDQEQFTKDQARKQASNRKLMGRNLAKEIELLKSFAARPETIAHVNVPSAEAAKALMSKFVFARAQERLRINYIMEVDLAAYEREQVELAKLDSITFRRVGPDSGHHCWAVELWKTSGLELDI
jgi:hypothetical protein